MLQPDPNSFDSGRIAARVGSVILGPDGTLQDADVLDLTETAATQGYDLISIEASVPLQTTLLECRGTLVELEGHRDEILTRARLADPRFQTRTLQSEAEWAEVEGLLRYAASTRFSTDAHVSSDAVRRHKLALLKTHVQNRQGEVALACSMEEPGQAVGYHCTSIEDGRINLYEIAIAPPFRRGFAGLNLIRHNLERFVQHHAGADRVVTRIYEDNTPSIRFFEQLGLKPTSRRRHYYHLWGTPRS